MRSRLRRSEPAPELGTRKIQSTSCKTGVVSCRVDQEVPDRNRRTACRAGSTPIEGGEDLIRKISRPLSKSVDEPHFDPELLCPDAFLDVLRIRDRGVDDADIPCGEAQPVQT
jgi:hypothetical protein